MANQATGNRTSWCPKERYPVLLGKGSNGEQGKSITLAVSSRCPPAEDLEDGEIYEPTSAPRTGFDVQASLPVHSARSAIPRRINELRANGRPRSSTSGSKRSASNDWEQSNSKQTRSTGLTDVSRSRRDPFMEDERLALTRRNCLPGTIFTAMAVEPLLDMRLLDNHINREPDDRIIAAGSDGYLLCKTRPWIVIAVFEDSYQAIPMYTHKNTGLDGKRHNPEWADEYVRIEAPDGWEGKVGSTYITSDRRCLKSDVIYGNFPWKLYSYAQLTYTVSRRFAGKASVIGKLRYESTCRLVDIMSEYAPWKYNIPVNRWLPPPLFTMDQDVTKLRRASWQDMSMASGSGYYF
jgi:hypothetical protein